MNRAKEIIAANIAPMLKDGDIVNLGVGMPSLVSKYIRRDIQILIHSENGYIGQERELPFEFDFNNRSSVISWLDAHGDNNGNYRTGHRDLCNASDAFVTLIPGASCFDSVLSFTIARGGHLDATVLGALQVDSEGNLANWCVPGKKLNGMGGAMDLVSGAKKVIVAMEHLAKDKTPKLVKKCTMPLTGIHCVDVLVTENCIVEFKEGKGTVVAMAPGITKNNLMAITEAELTFVHKPSLMIIPNEF